MTDEPKYVDDIPYIAVGNDFLNSHGLKIPLQDITLDDIQKIVDAINAEKTWEKS